MYSETFYAYTLLFASVPNVPYLHCCYMKTGNTFSMRKWMQGTMTICVYNFRPESSFNTHTKCSKSEPRSTNDDLIWAFRLLLLRSGAFPVCCCATSSPSVFCCWYASSSLLLHENWIVRVSPMRHPCGWLAVVVGLLKIKESFCILLLHMVIDMVIILRDGLFLGSSFTTVVCYWKKRQSTSLFTGYCDVILARVD